MGEFAITLAERRGRPQSIPLWAFGKVFRLHENGYGCRKIVEQLEGSGVYTTRSSVSRLLLGRPPYTKMSTTAE